MPFTRWSLGVQASVVRIDDELVLVFGSPQRIVVLDHAKAWLGLWRMLQTDTVVTRSGTSAHDFCTALEASGLVNGRPAAPESVPIEDDARAPPRILHSGVVELLVYGGSGGCKPDMLGPEMQETGGDWPFPGEDSEI